MIKSNVIQALESYYMLIFIPTVYSVKFRMIAFWWIFFDEYEILAYLWIFVINIECILIHVFG